MKPATKNTPELKYPIQVSLFRAHTALNHMGISEDLNLEVNLEIWKITSVKVISFPLISIQPLRIFGITNIQEGIALICSVKNHAEENEMQLSYIDISNEEASPRPLNITIDLPGYLVSMISTIQMNGILLDAVEGTGVGYELDNTWIGTKAEDIMNLKYNKIDQTLHIHGIPHHIEFACLDSEGLTLIVVTGDNTYSIVKKRASPNTLESESILLLNPGDPEYDSLYYLDSAEPQFNRSLQLSQKTALLDKSSKLIEEYARIIDSRGAAQCEPCKALPDSSMVPLLPIQSSKPMEQSHTDSTESEWIDIVDSSIVQDEQLAQLNVTIRNLSSESIYNPHIIPAIQASSKLSMLNSTILNSSREMASSETTVLSALIELPRISNEKKFRNQDGSLVFLFTKTATDNSRRILVKGLTDRRIDAKSVEQSIIVMKELSGMLNQPEDMNADSWLEIRSELKRIVQNTLSQTDEIM
ncbi:hypothetical protein K493DRAFT_380608 [Basidiobolus meristosporus CBS 931.73]|uniref:Uncharacterized protein n=1 Tax=Basidiobolus meristosporus CBS 931.73 TaxID=1314790 RepID=A0A1Y1XXN1_9FUNG|nr:hypothetical protein K493DRAFT_380608 [Basidiobolus meristosporus CBS 931.73]|eukprot:ORX90501.1 hypothetical protein K493DRAFT_380608 [Basidiobolus meristosporus CBS 931.73]